LFTKEFSVSTAPEVGRIIDFWNLPSTPIYAFLSITCRRHENRPISLYIEEQNHAFYIEGVFRALPLP
ncbi:hypothetical protein, partial [Pseudomonas sp. JAI111]|uniref:hypothetical protein n=1 Tax=Pseudomonas sp. JAI111 TaxID=2735913 RepID=UPI00216A64AF